MSRFKGTFRLHLVFLSLDPLSTPTSLGSWLTSRKKEIWHRCCSFGPQRCQMWEELFPPGPKPQALSAPHTHGLQLAKRQEPVSDMGMRCAWPMSWPLGCLLPEHSKRFGDSLWVSFLWPIFSKHSLFSIKSSNTACILFTVGGVKNCISQLEKWDKFLFSF